MWKKSLAALCLAMLGSSAMAAEPIVVTFDDVPSDYHGWSLPDGYGGATDWRGYLRSNASVAVSGRNYVHGGRIEVSFDKDINFVGAYYNSWGGASGGYSFELFSGGNLVFQGPADDGSDCCALKWVASTYQGAVDKVVFYGSSDGAVIDNFTYTVAAVPEPESYAMLVAGLGMMGAIARRRKMA